ncbi:MAG: microcin ABC transporter permease, partial [Burkholderiaceae bacterium]|nr:microcin ABC transporter permease [Burkholderiaceae bacterium]
MFTYLLKRLGLVIPTLIGILTINFFVIQMAPGGPVEQFIAKMEGSGDVFMERVGTSMGDFSAKGGQSGELRSNANQRIDPEILDAVKKLYGFDKPIGERY